MLRGCIVLGAFLVATAALADDPFLRRTAAVEAVQSAGPAVVNVTTERILRQGSPFRGPFADPFFDRFFQDFFEPHAQGSVENLGSGVLIDAAGHVLTNEHVVARATRIQVSFADGREFDATLLGADPNTDVAVLSIDTQEKLPWIKPGTSSDLMVGEPVIAIGNPFGLSHTVTTGVISALERSIRAEDRVYHGFIQTDASINPGNSGGPLLNAEGKLIGINTAVYNGAQGIGFAIPIDEALEIAARLMSTERLEQTSHGIVGKTVCEPNRRQFVVSTARDSSPAGRAGLKSGDVITAIGGHKVERSLDIELALLGQPVGSELEVEVHRNGQTLPLQLALSPLSRTTPKPALADRSWTTLGLRLAVMDAAEFNRLGTRYRGGLTVLEVRPNSPAAIQGIRRGDVLVGMHVWETVSLENIAYILDRDDLTKLDSVVFYIVRGSDTLFGHLRLAQRTP